MLVTGMLGAGETHGNKVGTHRIHTEGKPACLNNLAQGHGQCAGEGTRYGWSPLCPGKALTPHLSAEVGPRASYGDIFGFSSA